MSKVWLWLAGTSLGMTSSGSMYIHIESRIKKKLLLSIVVLNGEMLMVQEKKQIPFFVMCSS
jgi:hypothetical protein